MFHKYYIIGKRQFSIFWDNISHNFFPTILVTLPITIDRESKGDTYGIFQTDLVIHIFVKDAYNKNTVLLYKKYINTLVFLYNLWYYYLYKRRWNYG